MLIMRCNHEQKVLELLAREKKLTSEAAARELGVSSATVRRIFKHLSEIGEVFRGHGCVEAINHGMDPAYPFPLRMQWFVREKRALAECAAAMVADCRTIFVDGGTTTAKLGEFLNKPGLRVITNSLALNNVILQNHVISACPEVILTGGKINQKSAIMLGAEAESVIDHFHADVTIISGTTIDEFAIYDNMDEAAAIQRKMIANSDRLFVIADSSKFGKSSPARIVPIEKITRIITNFVSENSTIIQKMRDKGIEFTFVKVPNQDENG